MGIVEGLLGGALIGSMGVAAYGASKSADATKDAAKAQGKTADKTLEMQQKQFEENLAFQKAMYEAEQAREAPFYNTGKAAVRPLRRMALGGYRMQDSPAARYELQQGTRTLNRQLAARGLLGSGNAAMRLAELSSGVAARDYNDQWNRLTDMIKIGTGASAATGAAGQAYGGQIAAANQALTQQMGNWGANQANAQGQAGQARAALYSGLGGLPLQTLNTGLSAYSILKGGIIK